MKTLIIASFIVLSASFAQAQTPVSGSEHLAWDQAAPSLSAASSYGYVTKIDGATTNTPVTGVTCLGSVSPFQCKSNLPTLSVGIHALQQFATLTFTDVNGNQVTLTSNTGSNMVQVDQKGAPVSGSNFRLVP